jgi:hypothetical protein
MSKIISVEKTKILKHVEEINSLKVDNMKLIGQLQEQQSAVTKMSEQIKTLEEIEPIDDLKVKLQNVTEERDYLHTMLQDNVELDLFDVEKKIYTPETRL